MLRGGAPRATLVALGAPVPPLLLHLLGHRGRAAIVGLDNLRSRRGPRLRYREAPALAADWRTWMTWSQHPTVAPALARVPDEAWLLVVPGAGEVCWAAGAEARTLVGGPPASGPAEPPAIADPTGSLAQLRSEMAAWLDGYAAGAAAR